MCVYIYIYIYIYIYLYIYIYMYMYLRLTRNQHVIPCRLNPLISCCYQADSAQFAGCAAHDVRGLAACDVDIDR